MLAKRFFYVCAGILCLALAYHLGAKSATAQVSSNTIAGTFSLYLQPGGIGVVTQSGDVYTALDYSGPWTFRANVFGSATPAQQETFGSLKARYRPSTDK